jgi:hypothetical protein
VDGSLVKVKVVAWGAITKCVDRITLQPHNATWP